MNPHIAQPNPSQALSEALRAVIEEAVSEAIASVKATTADDPVMFSVSEAAQRLGVGATKVKQLIASGQLASVTIGRRRLVPATNVRSFGARHNNRGLASQLGETLDPEAD